MKKEIHPEYKKSTVKCSCGNTFITRSTDWRFLKLKFAQIAIHFSPDSKN